MSHAEWTKSFYTATHLLPERLWKSVFALSPEERMLCEEIRLRVGRPLAVTVSQKTRQIHDAFGMPVIVQPGDLEETLMRMTQSSMHTYLSQLIHGFFTTEQGHRVGVCGELVYQNGQVSSVKNVASVNIRIAKECQGIGEGLLSLRNPGESVLIISPPGSGKTTLLRDLARISSQSFRVSIVDERYELAACTAGKPRFHVGQCDVVSGGSKRDSIELLLRCMSPEIIVLDEITRPEDSEAVLEAWGCGCDFFASAHGQTVEDLFRRPAYQKLLKAGIFQHIIKIEQEAGVRTYRVQKGGIHAEAAWGNHDRGSVFNHGDFYQSQAAGSCSCFAGMDCSHAGDEG